MGEGQSGRWAVAMGDSYPGTYPRDPQSCISKGREETERKIGRDRDRQPGRNSERAFRRVSAEKAELRSAIPIQYPCHNNMSHVSKVYTVQSSRPRASFSSSALFPSRGRHTFPNERQSSFVNSSQVVDPDRDKGREAERETGVVKGGRTRRSKQQHERDKEREREVVLWCYCAGAPGNEMWSDRKPDSGPRREQGHGPAQGER